MKGEGVDRCAKHVVWHIFLHKKHKKINLPLCYCNKYRIRISFSWNIMTGEGGGCPRWLKKKNLPRVISGPDTGVCGLKKKKKRKRKKKKGRGGREDPDLTISTRRATTQASNLQNTSLSCGGVSCDCLRAVEKRDTGYSLRFARSSGFVCSF